MKLEVNGTAYENFLSASAEIRLDALSNSFSFSAASTKKLPFVGGESCRVLVDDQVVITGYIERISGGYDSGSHTISIQGRDKTGDFLDSSISELSDITPPISLKAVIEKVIQNIGADISVVDNANPEPFNKAEDSISPESGDNAFEFIEKLARKRNVLLTSNGDGNIVITKSSGDRINGRLINRLNGQDNNILSASFSYDLTKRFNVYKMASSLNPLALAVAGEVKNDDIVSQKGEFTDSDVRSGRQLVITPESSFSNEQNVKRVEWESRIRRVRGKIYSASVQGYHDGDGNLWDINKIIKVVDDFAGIDAFMLINSIIFGLDSGSGSTTILNMVEQNAYSLELEEPRTDGVGSGFLF